MRTVAEIIRKSNLLFPTIIRHTARFPKPWMVDTLHVSTIHQLCNYSFASIRLPSCYFRRSPVCAVNWGCSKGANGRLVPWNCRFIRVLRRQGPYAHSWALSIGGKVAIGLPPVYV